MLKKHIDTAKEAMKSQAAEEKPAKKKSDEMDFLPAYLEIMERPPANVARSFVFAIMAFCTIALTWSILGHVDIIASAPGQLQVGGRTKVIQAPENGEVRKILVTNGQRVQANEVLIELNPTTALAEMIRLTQQISHSSLEVARLNALTSEDPEKAFLPPAGADPVRVTAARIYLKSEFEEQQAQQQTFEAQLRENQTQQLSTQKVIKNTNSLLKNVTERYNRFKKLADQGNFPKLQLLEIEKEMLEQQRELEQQKSSLETLKTEAVTLNAQRAQQRAEWLRTLLQRLDEQSRSLIDYKQELVKAEEQSRLQSILAPVNGVVQELAIHTIGGVVTPAQELMKIVPEDAKLVGDIKVLNKDAGFVRPEQLVEVKIDSFPYTKYGTIKGKVLHISRDAVEDEDLGQVFKTRIQLDQDHVVVKGEKVLLTAGMSVTAEIKTGDRRIIDFLLDPIQNYIDTAITVK